MSFSNNPNTPTNVANTSGTCASSTAGYYCWFDSGSNLAGYAGIGSRQSSAAGYVLQGLAGSQLLRQAKAEISVELGPAAPRVA